MEKQSITQSAKSDLVVEVALSSGGAIETLRQPAKLIVADNLTHDIKRVRWQVETPLRYKAGQYLNVHWGGSDHHRSYSFALSPRVGRSDHARNLYPPRPRRDLYAAEEIARVRRAWLGRFDYWPVLSEEAAEGIGSGMVTDHVAAAFDRLGPGAQAYMCGPPPMIDAGIAAVSGLGVGMGDVHHDKFADASSRG